jgi:hypothetical protein
MKQRVSMMGSSEFEFNPNLLDERINNRESFFNQQLKNIDNYINGVCTEYQKIGLGNFENAKGYLLRELLKRYLKEWE